MGKVYIYSNTTLLILLMTEAKYLIQVRSGSEEPKARVIRRILGTLGTRYNAFI